jgi:hypothetical protein
VKVSQQIGVEKCNKMVKMKEVIVMMMLIIIIISFTGEYVRGISTAL